MTTAVVDLNGLETTSGGHPLLADLDAVGIQVLAVSETRRKLVQDAVRHAPDVVICMDPLPGEALFLAVQTIADTAPCAVLVFSQDADAERIARAVACGMHGYVVNGYSQQRLRSLVHLAMARFKREQALHAQLADVTSRFEERKTVDQAKGILMRARQVSDDDAYQMLRTASMHSNQRMGQLSRRIIHSARFAEALNRAGQLRMLSQRLVKLYALRLSPLAELGGTEVGGAFEQSVQRVDANLAALQKGLSPATFGDLMAAVITEWVALRQALQSPATPSQVIAVDRLAQCLLEQAERLTNELDNAGAAPPLHVLNVAARQRMLSQRFAKLALMQAMGNAAAPASTRADLAATRQAFQQAMQYLEGIPLSSPAIRSELLTATDHWQALGSAVQNLASPQALGQLASSSEALLQALERLVTELEHSMQMLVG